MLLSLRKQPEQRSPKETIEKGKNFVEERTQTLDRWFDETVEKGREILHERGTFLSELVAKKENPDRPDIFSILFNSINIMQRQIAQANLRRHPAEVLLSPDLAKVRLLDFDKIEHCILEGERAAQASLDDIRQTIERATASSPSLPSQRDNRTENPSFVPSRCSTGSGFLTLPPHSS